jgi:isopenicillin-N epimerase
MNRRSFMVRTGTMLGTGAVAGVMPFPLIAVDTSNDRALSELSDWDTVRAQFNLAPKKINMSCYWQASHPKPVRDAIEQHRRGLDECPSEYYEDNAPRLEASVRSVPRNTLRQNPKTLP